MSCRPILRDVLAANPVRHFRDDPAFPAERRAASCRCGDGARAEDRTAPHGFGPLQWRHRPLEAWRAARRRRAHGRPRHHDLPTGVQRLERRTGKSVAIGTARPGVVTIIPAGSSARWDIPGPVNVVQLYLPHSNARARCRRSRHAGSGRSAGANGASRPHHIPIAHERGGCVGGQRGPGCAVPASADRSPGHAPPGCACRLADRRSSRPWAGWRRRRCAARSNACARTAMRTSPSPRWLRMPACRASTSAAPSRKAPGSRRMPGCASTGSSRP